MPTTIRYYLAEVALRRFWTANRVTDLVGQGRRTPKALAMVRVRL